MPTSIIIIAIIGGIAVLLALILLAVRKQVNARIEGFSWQRSIATEYQVWTKESSYKEFPKNSRNRKTRQESYRKSTTVYRDKYVYRPDNPGPEDYVWVSEPVTEWKWDTRTRYEYEVPQWKRGRTLWASGRSRTDVHWPDDRLEGAEARRNSAKTESYTVRFVATNGKRYHKDLTEKAWMELDTNADYLLKTTLSGKVAQWQTVAKKPVAASQTPHLSPQP
jgi:hypothetical protein